MTDDRYNSLKKKYDELLKENEYLRAKVLKLESPQNFVTSLKANPVQSTQSKQKDEFDFGQKSVDSSEHTEIYSESTINQYSPINKKILLFMSLFRGRNDVYAKKWEI